MSGHPLLTTNVYIGIAVAFLAMMVYWFIYSRTVRARRAKARQESHPPLHQREAIARDAKESEIPVDLRPKP